MISRASFVKSAPRFASLLQGRLQNQVDLPARGAMAGAVHLAHQPDPGPVSLVQVVDPQRCRHHGLPGEHAMGTVNPHQQVGTGGRSERQGHQDEDGGASDLRIHGGYLQSEGG